MDRQEQIEVLEVIEEKEKQVETVKVIKLSDVFGFSYISALWKKCVDFYDKSTDKMIVKMFNKLCKERPDLAEKYKQHIPEHLLSCLNEIHSELPEIEVDAKDWQEQCDTSNDISNMLTACCLQDEEDHGKIYSPTDLLEDYIFSINPRESLSAVPRQSLNSFMQELSLKQLKDE